MLKSILPLAVARWYVGDTDQGKIQTHKSFIVNTNYIETIAKEGILLKGDICVPLGRKYELLVSRMTLIFLLIFAISL
jgi:hypothetical protein